MFRKFKTKTKFLLPISILILVFLMVTTSLITIYYSKVSSLRSLHTSVVLATKISQLIHETQKERGYSSGYITNKGLKFKKELLAQRIETDKKIIVLEKFISNIHNEHILQYLKKPLGYIEKIKQTRILVDNLSISLTKELQFYSNMNDKFLDVIVNLSKFSKVAQITQNLIAYSSFLYAKENAGIERALGTVILSQNKFKKNQRVHFITIIAAQKLYLKTFLNFTSKDGKLFYKKIVRGKDIDNVSKIRNIIFSKEKDFDISASFWFNNITSKINKLKLVDNFLEKEILTNINQDIDKTYRYFLFYTLLNLFGILVFIGIVIVVLRLIYNERKLKAINDKYIISSVTDTKGKILDASDAFCSISGYSREELIGKPHSIVRHPDMPKSAFKDLWDTIKQGKTWQGRVKNLKKDGGYYWVYANIEPIFDKKGKIEAYAAIRLDITDSIHLQEELQKSQKKDKMMLQQSKLAQMGEMIAMIAHQWRQPLTAISSTASDLYMKIMFDKYESHYFSKRLEKVDDLSQHLSKTIDDFRNFYKEDREKKSVKFSDITRESLDIVSASIENKHIRLETEFTAEKIIAVYPNELKQVILSLIKNAEDALVDKEIVNPMISIKTYDDAKNSYFEVKDNAGGIDENIMKKIFDPYFSTKTKKDGTGLGLHMSKIIVEDHCDGKLIVCNEDDGALFKISIPIIKEPNV